MNIKEVVERLEQVFPIDDISLVGKVVLADAKDPEKNKVGWKILIGQPTVGTGILDDKQ